MKYTRKNSSKTALVSSLRLTVKMKTSESGREQRVPSNVTDKVIIAEEVSYGTTTAVL